LPLRKYVCKLDGYHIVIPSAETAEGMFMHIEEVHGVTTDWKAWFAANVTSEEISVVHGGTIEVKRR